MRRRLVRQRRHVETAEDHERACRAVGIRELVRPPGIGDVDLNHHEIRPIVEREPRHVLVLDHGFVVRREIRGQRGEPEGREE